MTYPSETGLMSRPSLRTGLSSTATGERQLALDAVRGFVRIASLGFGPGQSRLGVATEPEQAHGAPVMGKLAEEALVVGGSLVGQRGRIHAQEPVEADDRFFILAVRHLHSAVEPEQDEVARVPATGLGEHLSHVLAALVTKGDEVRLRQHTDR